MSFCVFRFVGKRCPAPYAFAAMCFPLLTMGYQYAYEGRPYGMVMGLAGLAMVSWQSAAENQNRGIALGGLALSLTCAVSSHYYAVFFAGPIALGEIARSISRKRADVPIWLALGAGLTPLVALRPLIHSATSNIFARPLYSPNFFAKPGFAAMLASYAELMAPAVPVLVAGLVIAAISSA